MDAVVDVVGGGAFNDVDVLKLARAVRRCRSDRRSRRAADLRTLYLKYSALAGMHCNDTGGICAWWTDRSGARCNQTVPSTRRGRTSPWRNPTS